MLLQQHISPLILLLPPFQVFSQDVSVADNLGAVLLFILSVLLKHFFFSFLKKHVFSSVLVFVRLLSDSSKSVS